MPLSFTIPAMANRGKPWSLDFQAAHVSASASDPIVTGNYAGVYMFMGWLTDPQPKIFYIGHCDNFRTSINSHALLPRARDMGAIWIATCAIPDQLTRAFIHACMVGRFKPPLNTSRP